MFGHDDMNPQPVNQGDDNMGAPQVDTSTPLQHDDGMSMPQQHPAAPAPEEQPHTVNPPAPAANDDDDDSAGDYIMTDPPHAANPAPAPAAPSTPAPAADVSTDDLLELKQGALQQLTPLLDHLDQSPLDKFRTTMMMIQASDNQALLKTAYETAQQIPDEKIRAQALLDVVNEINYFTQNGAAAANGNQPEAHDQDAL